MNTRTISYSSNGFVAAVFCLYKSVMNDSGNDTIPEPGFLLILISDKKWTNAARLSPCKDDNEVLRKIDRKDCLFFI